MIADGGNGRIQILDLFTGKETLSVGKNILNMPSAVAVSAVNIVAVDLFSNEVFVFTYDTGSLVARFGGKGSERGKLNGVFSVAVTHDNKIVVPDTQNHRVCFFSLTGELLNVWGTGVAGTGPGQFSAPSAVAVTESGEIIIAESMGKKLQRIRVYTSSGEPRVTLGEGTRTCLKVHACRHGVMVVTCACTAWSCSLQPRGLIMMNHLRVCYECSHVRTRAVDAGGHGTNPGQFDRVLGLTVSEATKEVLVSDYYNHRVQVFRLVHTNLRGRVVIQKFMVCGWNSIYLRAVDVMM
jgi:hypothetical protein